MTPADTLQRYFAETMTGDLDAVARFFPEPADYVLIADDDPPLNAVMPWVGRWRSHAEIKRAYEALLDALEVLEARPGHVVEQDERVAVDGVFRYRARATDRIAESAWAAHARVRGDQIVEYRFYENAFAVARALRSDDSEPRS
jgi:hypothetical protein